MVSIPEESSEVVQAYLSYLQEMSRKISLRNGMENTLYGKPKNSHHYYRAFEGEDVDSQYLRNIKGYLEKESDRQLFLGSGLIVGSLKKKTKKYIAAPLIYFLVKIDLDENGRSLTYSIEWESVSLNYDLVTLILEQDLDEEDDETEFESAGIDNKKLEILEDIENNLEKILKDNCKKLITNELTSQVFQQIYEKISEFNQVNLSTEEFTLKKIDNLSRENLGLTFYNHQFFYIASLPGQLSTYTALRKLISEVS